MLGLAWRRAVLILAIAALVGWMAVSGHAQSGHDLAQLNKQVEELVKAGKYAEALPLAERAIRLAEEEHGANDVAVTGPLLMLGEVLGGLGRVAEVEPLEE